MISKKISVLAILSSVLAVSAFASKATVCDGKFGTKGTASVVLTTAEDDNAEGSVSVMLFSGMPTSMPVHLVFDVIQIDSNLADSDVSYTYKDATKGSRTKLKISDNPAMGESYIKNIPGFRKIDLSCK